MVKTSLFFGLALALPLAIGFGAEARADKPAQSAIACSDEFQDVEGRATDTPYCEDAYLAKVAREHGSKVTASELRNNPNLKSEICRFVGADTRAKATCGDDADDE